MSYPRITAAAYTSASPADIRTGLLGWVSCVVDDTLLLDGITLRRTRDGRITLAYPARRDSRDREHFYIRPRDDRARRDIEAQVFAQLGIEQEVQP